MALIPGPDIITAAKGYADAADPNAGAWLAALWQPWLDEVYAVLYDRLLYTGAMTPVTKDTTVNYVGTSGGTPPPRTALPAADTRAIVDVFWVQGSVYYPVDSAQHSQQFPNLDLQPPGVAGIYSPGRAPYAQWQRAWAAFLDPHTGEILLSFLPKDQNATYLVRTVPDPDTSTGYVMPHVGKNWIALQMARRALSAEGVLSQAINQQYTEADAALQAYLDSFQLKHERKVTTAPYGKRGGARRGPEFWWWRQ